MTTLTKPGKKGYFHEKKAKIYFEVYGSGEPIVLIHAGVTDSRMWNFQINDLAKHFQVIRYDMRGFGKSKKYWLQHCNIAGSFSQFGKSNQCCRFP